MPIWDPDQYLKFANHRLRPALDLMARIPLASCRSVWDLGCGTGNVTRLLAERWPEAAVYGLDSSADMLSKARAGSPAAAPEQHTEHHDIVWIHDDIAAWTAPEPVDLLFSNAALHWLPDHGALLPRLVGQLTEGGVLAVQVPRNFSAPSHTLLHDTALDGPWADRLAPLAAARAAPVAPPEVWWEWLAPHARSIDIWETEYLHALRGPDAVVEWTRGTALKPFLDALPPEERPAFLAAYTSRVAQAYPTRTDGITLFPFRRLFAIVRR